MNTTGTVGRLRGWLDSLRTRLWPIPVLAVLAALALGVALPHADRSLQTSAGGADPALFLFGGGADAARGVLSTIAGSVVTATSLTFSLTVVTLQLASSQYSPRLLRTFTRDTMVQATLGLFVATFTYALVVLRVVRSRDTDSLADDVFVPRLSVMVAVVLTLLSVVTFVLFLAHLAREIRVESVLARVYEETLAVVQRVYPDRVDAVDGEVPVRPSTGAAVRAPATGFLTAVREKTLAQSGRDADGLVVLDVPVGAFVVTGEQIGVAVDPTGGRELASCAAEALVVEQERTAVQDGAFGLRQLVDVAVRALSPGVNDPTTAVHALGWVSATLVDLAGRDCGPLVVRDAAGAARAVVARPSFAELVNLAMEQPLHYGSGDPQVARRLSATLDQVARVVTTTGPRITVRAWLGRLEEAVAHGGLDDAARHAVRVTTRRTADRLRDPDDVLDLQEC